MGSKKIDERKAKYSNLEYQTSSASYNSIGGGEALYEVVVDDRMYKVETDENGTPVKLSRYSEAHNMWVIIKFSSERSNEVAKSITEALKDVYINRVLGIIA